ncbi:MAG TPA: hypothetical protein VL463_22680 [Kofleriaceae bacterium]|nr:hypothetical protein [Kofleriaceae bacterium]
MITTWARVVGAAAAERALPVWAGVGVVVAIVFGGTGMQPHDLTRLAIGERGVGAALAVMWIVLVVPVGAAMIDPPGAAWMRALPSSRIARGAITAAVAIAAQGPWMILWGSGEGPLAGAIAGISAAAIMMIAARVRLPMRRTAPTWRGPVRALAGVHARTIVRTRGAAIARAIAWSACGGLGAGLVARENELDALVPILVAIAIAAPAGIAGVAGTVAESDRAIAWASLAASRGARAAAQAIVLASSGAALGVIAAIAAMILGAGGPIEVAAGAALGAALGATGVRAGAWGVRDGTRVVVGMTGAAVASALAIGALGAWAIAGVAAAAAGLVAPLASRSGA